MFYVENNWKVTECDTLKEAVECADGDACYTQQPIKIYGGKYWQTWSDVANDEPILWRSWCPVAYDPDDEDAFNEDSIFDFGDYGYYQPWATKNGWYEGKTQEEYMLDELGEKYQSYEAKKVGGWADVEEGYNPDGIDMSKKYEVEYSAGESNIFNPEGAADYMFVNLGGIELYAECYPACDDIESYPLLRKEIEELAHDNGVSLEILDFPEYDEERDELK